MRITETVYVRMDAELKHNAEAVLKALGIRPSWVIHMLYEQIVKRGGLPFKVNYPGIVFRDGEYYQGTVLKGSDETGGDESKDDEKLYTKTDIDELFEWECGHCIYGGSINRTERPVFRK